MTKAFHKIKYGLLCSAMACAIPLAQAANPVVNTTIAVDKTGTEPFTSGSTWTPGDPNTAGTDENADNDVVRMQDTIIYKVEVSVNDSAVDDLIATVHAVNGQVWQGIPSGCQTDAADVTSQPVSSISADGTELFCNMGPAIEGTTKVFRPAALTTGLDPETGDVIFNDTTVAAEVTAGADGNNNMASAGPVETIVTANFKVDLIKELKVTAVDPNTGDPLYSAPRKTGPANEQGVIIEYVIKAKYAKGSMIADGADEANGDFTADYTLVDVYTDNNDNNNPPGSPLSTGGILYTWDAALPACELVGDHGAGAAVNCSQLAATIDEMGPIGGAADGLQDGTIQIDLTDIDVRDPDADSNLFEIRLNIWFNRATEISNHQTCAGGNTCTNTVTNRVGLLPTGATALTPFDEDNDPNIVSTEDAGGNNLNNYNAGNEPYPNEISYPLIYPVGSSYSVHKSFDGIFPFNTRKLPDQNMAPGETRPFLIDIFDYRLIDGAQTHTCDKIDTEVFEYQGIAPPNQITSPPMYFWNNDQPYNPGLYLTGPAGANAMLLDGSDYVSLYYSNQAHAPVGATQAQYLEALRTNECNDDLDGDGVVNIVDKDGNESNPGNPIDWWQNPSDVPGGMAAITLMRQDTRYDAATTSALNPGHERFGIMVNHLIKAKDGQITGPYGSNNRLPNFASRRSDRGDGNFTNWIHVAANTTDPSDDANFSIVQGTADRMTLIASSHSLQKYTDPLNIDVVRGGDQVDFILKPQVLGQWDSNVVDTATLADNLPAGTTYIAGSEQFSTDGGATWLGRAAYDASSPAITITSAPHVGGADPLTWNFDSVDSGEQLPLVKYTVLVDPTAVSGTFKNTATLNSGSIGNDQTATAPYQIRILPQSGLDVKKTVDQPIYGVNTPFTYNLIYKNLGGEDYSAGEFIDILPFNGDGSGNTGGLASAREPATTFNGSYQLTGITAANGEAFWATDAAPASIPQDVCHEDNQASGYVPVAGDLCYAMYTNNGNKFAGGSTAGTGIIAWTACSNNNCPGNSTAVRFTTPAIPKAGGGKTVKIELDPIGNRGGTPDLDADGNVTDDSTGDIYTNNFGGRVPEISLPVISNDVSVTMVAGSIGDYVWLDANGDGVQDPGEAPIPGTELALLDVAGNAIYVDANGNVVPAGTAGAIPYTTTTGSDGKYLFDNLPAGDYRVQVTNLPLPSLKQTYDADGIGTGNISAVTLAPITDPLTGAITDIEDNLDQDFGYQQLGSIGDTIYHDMDNDGEIDQDEGLDNVTVTLTPPPGVDLGNGPGQPISTTTDANGNYLFENLPEGNYTVTVDKNDLPTGLAGHNTQDPDGGNDSTSSINLGAGEQNLDQDFGYYAPGSIGDTIYHDLNNDGVADPGEGIDGVTVTLTPPAGVDIGAGPGNPITTTTDTNGNYLFPGLPAGDYTVTVDESTLPAALQGNNTQDPDGGTASESSVSLGIGEDNLDQDFGYYAPGTIGDTIYHDANNDGVIDPGEGLYGVDVTLTPPPGVDIGAGPGNPITTTTDTNGNYLFTDLPPGDYTVTVDENDLPAALRGNNTQDPDGGTASESTVSLGAGESNLEQDFGYFAPGIIGDTIYHDMDNDGVIDAGEGLERVTVTLTPPAGVDIGAGPGNPITTTTNANGQYLFDGLPAATGYIVTVDENTLPAALQGNNTQDPDGGNNSTSTVDLGVGDSNLDQDFGYYTPGIIGNTIYNDANNDGVVDPGEGLERVTVTLTPPAGIDLGNGPGQPISTTTDANGNYSFTGLPPGDYTVAVDESTLPTALQGNNTQDPDGGTASQSSVSLGAGESNLNQNFGYFAPGIIGDTIYHDMNNDGVIDAGEGLERVTVTLTPPAGVDLGNGPGQPITTTTDANGNYAFTGLPPGDYTVTVDESTLPAALQGNNTQDPDGGTASESTVSLGAGESNLDQDFGYFAPGIIGDTIYHDMNNDGVIDAGEGLADVVVTLTPPAGVDLGNGPGQPITTTTDSNGNYTFTGLPAGEYTVTVDESTLPTGLQGRNTQDPDGGTASQSVVTLGEGESNLDQDFGYADPIVAEDDTYTTSVDQPVDLSLLINDEQNTTITSINGILLTGGAQSIPVPNGTVNIDVAGKMVFVPSPGYTGSVTFPYTIRDINGNTATAYVNINIPGGAPEPIPSGSIWSLLLLVGLMGLFANRRRQQA